MQIIEDKYRNLGSGIGSAFGSGLSQSLPQVSKQYGLSKALEDLQSGEFNPAQATSRLIRYGATPEQVAQLLPIYERQYKNKTEQKYAEQLAKAGGAPQAAQSTQETPLRKGVIAGVESGKPILPEKKLQKEFLKLVSPELEQKATNLVKPLTQEQLLKRAYELQQERPGLGPFDVYKDMATKENIAAREEQEGYQREYGIKSTQAKNLAEGIETRTKEKLSTENKKDLFNEIPGDFLAKVKREAEDELARAEKEGKKISSEKIIDQASSRLKKFADTRLELETIANTYPYRDLRKKLSGLQSAYAKEGEERLMKYDLMNKGKLSEPMASELAYPSNKKVDKWISKLKNAKNETQLSNTKEYAEGINILSENAASQLSKYLTDEDSLLGIANKIKLEKGYNPIAFMDQLKFLYNKGLLKNLSENQIEELQKSPDFIGSWGDFLINFL